MECPKMINEQELIEFMQEELSSPNSCKTCFACIEKAIKKYFEKIASTEDARANKECKSEESRS